MIILASSSPRRAELLTQVGIQFQQHPADVDESPFPDETGAHMVERLARLKAESVWLALPEKMPVLGSDTIGLLDDEILVKPKNEADFYQMLEKMSGATHSVLTAIAICHDGHCQSQVVESEVTFGQISEEQMKWYWQTGEPADKAGGYAIQGLGGQFVKNIRGSYSSIVGLPLYETCAMLENMEASKYER